MNVPLRFVWPDGRAADVALLVGKPYAEGGDLVDMWRCLCSLEGFEERYVDIAGEDPLQALCLALGLIRRRMKDFLTQGGTVFSQGGSAGAPEQTSVRTAYTLESIDAVFGNIVTGAAES